MTKVMNSSLSSDFIAIVIGLNLLVGAVGAVTVSEASVPSTAEVNSDQSATLVLTDLYQNPDAEQWTLVGETELRNVTWRVQVVDQGGTQIGQSTYTRQTFEHDVNIESGAAELRISITGTVPTIGNYTYEPQESFLMATLTHSQPGGTSETIQSYEVPHYTIESRDARQAIDDAQAAIETMGGHQEANETLDSAIQAYEGGNFELAVDLANSAEDTANQAQSTQSRNRLILLAVGALVLIGVIIGAVIYWRRSRTQSRL